jgi:predicted HD phosphohydrolase
MSMADRLLDALARSAARLYGGEAVSELEHALQAADLAREAGAHEELQLACLLHDVGRYAVDQALVSDTTEPAARPDAAAPPADTRTTTVLEGGAAPRPTPRGHHEMGAELIAPWVPERVAWCVRMHADAKRYLCATEPDYFDRLSSASRHTLRLQGGVMSPGEVARLAGHPWLEDALALRRWDDRAKVVGKPTRSLAAWVPLLRRYFDRSGASGEATWRC